MTETVYMDGDHLVREIRTPLNPEPVPEHVLVEYEEIWPEIIEEGWSHVPPSVRLEVLAYAAKGGCDIAEAVVDVHLGVVPALTDEFKPLAHEYLWALVGSADFDADLIAVEIMRVVYEVAAEAKAEIDAGTSRMHEWRLWLFNFFQFLHSEVIEALEHRMKATWFDAEDEDWTDWSCECCSEVQPASEARRAATRSAYTRAVTRAVSILQEHEERFDELYRWDYGIVWNKHSAE